MNFEVESTAFWVSKWWCWSFNYNWPFSWLTITESSNQALMSNIRVDLVESESGSLYIRRTRIEVLGGEYSKCHSLVSSDHAILTQSSHVLYWYSCAHLRYIAVCCSCNNDHLTALHFHICTSWSRQRIVDFETSILVMLHNSTKDTCIWVSAAATMYLSCTIVVIHGHPGCLRFVCIPWFLRCTIKLDIVWRRILNE